jgi:hypothetical protein
MFAVLPTPDTQDDFFRQSITVATKTNKQASKQANKQTNKLRGFSLPANYTDRATAACRQC